MIWVLKHGHIGDAFFDTDAAEFLLNELTDKIWHNKNITTAAKQLHEIKHEISSITNTQVINNLYIS